MSPEQREGRGCDHKADIYALGVIFFELNYPFTTDSERFKVCTCILLLYIQDTFGVSWYLFYNMIVTTVILPELIHYLRDRFIPSLIWYRQ